MRCRLSTIALLAAAAGSAFAQEPTGAPQRFRLAGIVRDSAGSRLGGTEVRLLIAGSVADITRTSEDGRFSLVGQASGETVLEVRRLGFLKLDYPVNFPRDVGNALELVLLSSTVRLAEVDVLERAKEFGWLSEFNERRRTNSFGHFYTREMLAANRSRKASEILRMMPGVAVIAERGGNALRMRNCRVPPLVWVDGMRIPRSELDEVVSAEDIAGMEVYPSQAGVPAQYLDRANGGCGTIVVWTRHQ